jgi:exopolysaccharide production protein ExoZ
MAKLMKTLRSIQYLRGLAALLVVLYHAFQWTHVCGLTSTDFPTGAAGVDIFFVISGFVMWATTDQDSVSPLEFLRRRAVRIVPPYWALTLLAAVLAASLPWVFQDVRLDLGHLALSLLFVPHFDPGGEPFPLLKPGWTLVYEAFFYLVFAIGLALARRRRLVFLSVTLGITAFVGVFSNTASVLLANILLLEFLAGIFIARAWREDLLGGSFQGWSFVVLGVAALAVLESIDFHDYNWRPILWGVPAGLIVTGAVAAEAGGALPRLPGLKLLGDASYSIYLGHPLAFMALARLGGRPSSAALFIAEALATAVGCGLLGRHLIEKPTLRLFKGVGRSTPGFEPATFVQSPVQLTET